MLDIIIIILLLIWIWLIFVNGKAKKIIKILNQIEQNQHGKTILGINPGDKK